MSALNSEQLPILAGALLRLRGLTLAAVFDATGIRAANLSAWLKGRPQVISAARVTALLYHLGSPRWAASWSEHGSHLEAATKVKAHPAAFQPASGASGALAMLAIFSMQTHPGMSLLQDFCRVGAGMGSAVSTPRRGRLRRTGFASRPMVSPVPE